jgi:hypothetical protein
VGGLSDKELEEAARRIVESSCREQGLEVQITDPVVIGKVATILKVDSDPPLRRNSARIKPIAAPDRGVDRDRVEDRKKHGAFAA